MNDVKYAYNYKSLNSCYLCANLIVFILQFSSYNYLWADTHSLLMWDQQPPKNCVYLAEFYVG